ncbi:hypothetical protein S100390_v1c04500 [Spiroplasma sp. NBRC 100390]|nr:hypothetical protein STU14_v1c04500 [Spiroplasma sp. TU-14]APE13263.1 hypothetical protein S100390_v1c04500 [Spiroplasma sp. NBRC 100390]
MKAMVMKMKINFITKYQKFINAFFILFLGYIFFSSSFSIINLENNYSFLNITLNLLYLFLSSIIFLFFIGILAQILVNFQQIKRETLSTWKVILYSNWQIIILWLGNIFLISGFLFFGETSLMMQLKIIISYKAIYSFLIIFCYVFYAIFTLSFIAMLLLFRLYIGYLKNINDVIFSSYQTFWEITLANNIFYQHQQLSFSLLLMLLFKGFVRNRWFLKCTCLIDNLRKTELLTQFKKQSTPPSFIFN